MLARTSTKPPREKALSNLTAGPMNVLHSIGAPAHYTIVLQPRNSPAKLGVHLPFGTPQKLQAAVKWCLWAGLSQTGVLL